MTDNKKPKKLFDDNGRLYPIKSSISLTGVVSYYMERPKAKEPQVSEPKCGLHAYELVVGFQLDYEVCKFCKNKRWT